MKNSTLVVVAVVAAAAGFGIYRFGVEPRLLSQNAPKQDVAGQLSAEQPATESSAEAPADLPATLPEFTLANMDGQPQSILSWPGKSMVVNFWATWCAPCRREIPLLKELQKQHAPEGFQIVGVAVDFRDEVVKYAREIGIDYPVLIGEQDGLEAVNKFGQGSLGFPFTVFTDAQGRIVLFHLGEIDQAKAAVLFDTVQRVNRGELTPAAARVVAAKQLAALPKPNADA